MIPIPASAPGSSDLLSRLQTWLEMLLGSGLTMRMLIRDTTIRRQNPHRERQKLPKAEIYAAEQLICQHSYGNGLLETASAIKSAQQTDRR